MIIYTAMAPFGPPAAGAQGKQPDACALPAISPGKDSAGGEGFEAKPRCALESADTCITSPFLFRRYGTAAAGKYLEPFRIAQGRIPSWPFGRPSRSEPKPKSPPGGPAPGLECHSFGGVK